MRKSLFEPESLAEYVGVIGGDHAKLGDPDPALVDDAVHLLLHRFKAKREDVSVVQAKLIADPMDKVTPTLFVLVALRSAWVLKLIGTSTSKFQLPVPKSAPLTKRQRIERDLEKANKLSAKRLGQLLVTKD